MSDEKILMPKHLTAENGGDMSLQERVKEIIHRWKFTCTIPNEDFYEVINIVREHDKHEHASFALECSEQARADQRGRCIKAIELLDTWLSANPKEIYQNRRVVDKLDVIEAIKAE